MKQVQWSCFSSELPLSLSKTRLGVVVVSARRGGDGDTGRGRGKLADLLRHLRGIDLFGVICDVIITKLLLFSRTVSCDIR